jgi:hypothetical protein
MKSLTDAQKNRAVELLDVIVNPSVENFGQAIEEAQKMLGYWKEPVRIRNKYARSYYGIRKCK